MISALDVYLVMQLDAVRTFFGTVGFICGLAGVLCIIPAMIEDISELFSFAKKLIIASVLALLVATLLPSSKTAAAMIILPALTSDKVTEPLAREASELYGLAKKALEQAVDSEPSTQTSQEESK